MVAKLKFQCRSDEDRRKGELRRGEGGGHLNVRRFLFGIHFSKDVILTSANAADCSRLTPSSHCFYQIDKTRRKGEDEELG